MPAVVIVQVMDELEVLQRMLIVLDLLVPLLQPLDVHLFLVVMTYAYETLLSFCTLAAASSLHRHQQQQQRREHSQQQQQQNRHRLADIQDSTSATTTTRTFRPSDELLAPPLEKDP